MISEQDYIQTEFGWQEITLNRLSRENNICLAIYYADWKEKEQDIVARIADELTTITQSQDRYLLYYFCDNTDKRRDKIVGILRGLLVQLLRQRPGLFRHM